MLNEPGGQTEKANTTMPCTNHASATPNKRMDDGDGLTIAGLHAGTAGHVARLAVHARGRGLEIRGAPGLAGLQTDIDNKNTSIDEGYA